MLCHNSIIIYYIIKFTVDRGDFELLVDFGHLFSMSENRNLSYSYKNYLMLLFFSKPASFTEENACLKWPHSPNQPSWQYVCIHIYYNDPKGNNKCKIKYLKKLSWEKNAQDGIYTEGKSQTGYFFMSGVVPLRRTLRQNIICDIKEILENLRAEPHFELSS